MYIIQANLPQVKLQSYPIFIGENLLHNITGFLSDNYKGKKIVVICDYNVLEFVDKLTSILIDLGFEVLTLEVPPGEDSKISQVKEKLELAMLRNHINKYSLCIAFGGGVIGDLAGFIAATYMRGIDFIQIPTTLLAMVDSSIGGKTAINTLYGKNLIGAYHQPKAVFIDLEYLTSISQPHFINGLIEIIKIALVLDAKTFWFIYEKLDLILSRDKAILLSLIETAVKLKLSVIKDDVSDINFRHILNFGHTIGHAIELMTDFKILHGYAVGLGILVESEISLLKGYLSLDDYVIICQLIYRLGIVPDFLNDFQNDQLIEMALIDKKNVEANSIMCVLLSRIGDVVKTTDNMVISRVDLSLLKDALYLIQLK